MKWLNSLSFDVFAGARGWAWGIEPPRSPRPKGRRGVGCWAAYKALLFDADMAPLKLGYSIPYGDANRAAHPRCKWIDEVSRKYAEKASKNDRSEC